MDLMIKLWLVC